MPGLPGKSGGSLVKSLAKKKQLAVLMAIHDLNLVSIFADTVALLVNGELISLGTPQEVIRAEQISAAYRTPLEAVPHPVTGVPLIFPQEMLEQ